jgi:hypothetical protein
MFTLQILDRGQTFLHPLTDRPITLGSAPTDDVVLGEPGIAAAHARVEPHQNGARLVPAAATTVNGQRVDGSHELALGDRIEVGRAVLVVGRAVTRQASADDVLADAVPRPRRPARRERRSWLVPALAMGAAAAGVSWLAFGGSSTQRVDAELALVQRLRTEGRVDQAAAVVARLQQTWAGTADGRLERLDAEQQALAAIATTAARLQAEVADPAGARGYAEWSQELQRLEHEGTPAERVAARQVRSRLAETLSRRPKLAVAPAAAPQVVPTPATAPGSATDSPSPPSPSPSPATAAGTATAPVAPAAPAATATPVAPVAERTARAPAAARTATDDAATAVLPPTRVDAAEIDRLVAQGAFAQALALLHAAAAGQTDTASAAQLQQRTAKVREQAREGLARLLEAAKVEHVDYGPREAAKLLHGARHRFPPTLEFRALTDQIASYEALAAAPRPVRGDGNSAVIAPGAPTAPAGPVDGAVRAATLAELRALMDAVRRSEEDGAFAVAAQQLRAAADAVRGRDAGFADRLAVRADEHELLAAWHDAVAGELARGRTFAVKDADGAPLTITGVQGGSLRVAGSERRLGWTELGAPAVAAIAEQLDPTGSPALGGAALLYRFGDRAKAEAMLARLVRADAGCKTAVDRVIARGRGEPADPRGYSLGKDGFVAVRAVELQQQAAQLAQRLEAALRDRNPAARQKLVAEALAGGPEAGDVLVAALRAEVRRVVGKIDTGALKKQVEKLAAQRALVDDARRSAKELIFDEVKYFYPYKPPAVTSDRYAEYVRVQAEIDRRVGALRSLWNDDRIKVRVPASLRSDLDRLDWLVQSLASLGESEAGCLAQLEWVRALPPGDSIGVREHCATLAERAELLSWRTIDAYNAIVGKGLSNAQRELLQITNEYRTMFRHPPIAIVTTLAAASQGHADEMSRLGFFDHMSPTPGRRTPYDRMRLAGYQFGASENIALVDGALAAHIAWCHSSGHHRNLLDASHREIGIGANGRYWVQNFGSGSVHRAEPAWVQAENGAR